MWRRKRSISQSERMDQLEIDVPTVHYLENIQEQGTIAKVVEFLFVRLGMEGSKLTASK